MGYDRLLDDRIVLVSGGTMGVGAATAVAAAEAGASGVVITGRRPESAEATLDRISAAGAQARYLQADVARLKVLEAGDDVSAAAEAGRALCAARGQALSEWSFGFSSLVRGELQGGEAASFNALQQRLGRKNVTAAMQAEYPVFVRLYDILFDGAEDLRSQPWTARRDRLERFTAKLDPVRFDVSAVIEARDFEHLAEIRAAAREAAIEGVMLKRRDSPYLAGRKVGLWYKWKREPLVADCVMMYAQRGSGKRSSYYSDYTFGCWTEDGNLLPVGKAYSGFSDEELKWLDRFVRNNTVARFGPVREVEKSLVLEVAFDAVHESKRHKSGVAMRFPRISRLRRDKPAEEADTISALRAMFD